jgi:preprotein translocase subunit SecY
MRLFALLAKIHRSSELVKRILFTLAVLAFYRLGRHVSPPGIDSSVFALGI